MEELIESLETFQHHSDNFIHSFERSENKSKTIVSLYQTLLTFEAFHQNYVLTEADC